MLAKDKYRCRKIPYRRVGILVFFINPNETSVRFNESPITGRGFNGSGGSGPESIESYKKDSEFKED